MDLLSQLRATYGHSAETSSVPVGLEKRPASQWEIQTVIDASLGITQNIEDKRVEAFGNEEINMGLLMTLEPELFDPTAFDLSISPNVILMPEDDND